MFDWLNEIIESVKTLFGFSQPKVINQEVDVIIDTKLDFKINTESFKIKIEELLKKPFLLPVQIPSGITKIDLKMLEESVNRRSIPAEFAHKGCLVVHSYQLSGNYNFFGDLRNSEEKRHQYADSMKPYVKP